MTDVEGAALPRFRPPRFGQRPQAAVFKSLGTLSVSRGFLTLQFLNLLHKTLFFRLDKSLRSPIDGRRQLVEKTCIGLNDRRRRTPITVGSPRTPACEGRRVSVPDRSGGRRLFAGIERPTHREGRRHHGSIPRCTAQFGELGV